MGIKLSILGRIPSGRQDLLPIVRTSAEEDYNFSANPSGELTSTDLTNSGDGVVNSPNPTLKRSTSVATASGESHQLSPMQSPSPVPSERDQGRGTVSNPTVQARNEGWLTRQTLAAILFSVQAASLIGLMPIALVVKQPRKWLYATVTLAVILDIVGFLLTVATMLVPPRYMKEATRGPVLRISAITLVVQFLILAVTILLFMEETSDVGYKDIRCCKCQGRGHVQSQCPNKRSMLMKGPDPVYESVDEENDEEGSIYLGADCGPLLFARKVEIDSDISSEGFPSMQVKQGVLAIA